MSQTHFDDALALRLVEAAPDALLLVNDEGQIVFVNSQGEALFGYAPAELMGQPLEILLPTAHRALHAEKRAKFTAAPQSRPMGAGLALACRRRDGTELPVEISLSPVQTPAGHFVAAAVRDVSAQHRARKALHDAEELFRLTFEEAPIGMALVDLDGRFLRVNRSACRITGYTHEEMTRLTVKTITYPDDLGSDMALAGQLERGEIPHYQLAKRNVRKDGTVIDVIVSKSLVRDSHGKPLHYITQIQDVTEHKRAGEALSSSEERFRLTFEEAPIGMAIVSPDGRFLRVNRSLCQLFGYAPEELTALTFLDVTHPDDRGVHLGMEQQFTQGEIQYLHLKKRYVRKDGKTVDAKLSVSIVRDPQGRQQYNIAQIEDVTERKRAEEALRRSEESLARAQRVAHFGSWDWDLRTSEMSRSAELYEMFGIAPEPKYSQPRALSQFIHPDERGKMEAAVTAAIQEGRGFQIEYRILRDDGSERVLLSRGEVVHEPGGAKHLVGTVMDITERKRLEQAREELLRWLSAVLDECPAAMLLVHGARGEHIEVNRRARALLGCADDAPGANTGLVLYQKEALPLTGESHPIARALRGERIERAELSLQNSRGELVPILLDAEPILDKQGAQLGAVIVMEDITLLRQLDRLRAEWNSVVAHDLRQPLNFITVTAQLLARKKKSAPELAQPAEQIIASALRLNRMINDLLDLSRLEARKLALCLQPIDLSSLINLSVERICLEAPERRCEVRVLSEIPIVNVDSDRIAQVMDNLLSNAIKYGDPETPVEIDVESKGKEVEVAVSNSGSGIATDELPHLFQRFHRTDAAKHGPVKGVGLGLHIVQQLVEAHGGNIKAESTPGGRTTFRFTIPTTERATTPLGV